MAPSSRSTKENEKRERQVGMKLGPDLYARLSAASQIQQHRDGQLARILVEWALPFYEQARSVEGLNAVNPPVVSGRISRELQEQLFEALRIIIDNAPSEVVADEARRLTERAGKYGDPERSAGTAEKKRQRA